MFLLVLSSAPAIYCSSCLFFLYISLYISFLLYCSIPFFSITFLKHCFTCFHVGLNNLSITLHLTSYILLQLFCSLVYIVNIISSFTELLSFLVSYFQDSLIDLLSDTNIQHPTRNLVPS